MTDPDVESSFERRLREVTPSAAGEIDRCYRDRLCRLVAAQLSERIKQHEDPEDIVQSVLRTFFHHVQDGKFEVTNPAQLWQLLKTISRHKIGHHVEKILSDRNGGKYCFVPVPADDLLMDKSQEADARLLGDALEQALDGLESPDPEITRLVLFGYEISEILRTVLEDLPPDYARILQLRLQGSTQEEIAEQLEIGHEAVKYKLRRIIERLRFLLK